jgi:hypothetical protein
MAIRDERTGTEELLKDALYHYAALLADPATQPFAVAAKAGIDKLRKVRGEAEGKSDALLIAQATLDRTDYEIDDLVRRSELELLAETGKNRADLRYRSALPSGLTALVAKWGSEEARQVRSYRKALDHHFPAVSAKYGKDLDAKADATESAEKTWVQATTDLGYAQSAIVLARAELVRTLRKSEAALMDLFPGQRARVRSFFRKKRDYTADDGGKDPTPPPPVSD